MSDSSVFHGVKGGHVMVFIWHMAWSWGSQMNLLTCLTPCWGDREGRCTWKAVDWKAGPDFLAWWSDILHGGSGLQEWDFWQWGWTQSDFFIARFWSHWTPCALFLYQSAQSKPTQVWGEETDTISPRKEHLRIHSCVWKPLHLQKEARATVTSSGCVSLKKAILIKCLAYEE